MAMDMEKILAKHREISARGQQQQTTTSSTVGQDGIRYFKALDGQNEIRILPPAFGNDTFYVEHATHYKVGPNSKSIECPRTIGEKCPVCEYVSTLYNGTEEDKLLAKEIKAKKRWAINIIDVKNPQNGVQIYDIGETILEQILGQMMNPEVGDLTDPQTGRALIITKAGVGRDTKYSTSPKMSVSPLTEAQLTLSPNTGLVLVSKIDAYETVVGIMDGTIGGEQRKGSLSQFLPKDVEPTANVATTIAAVAPTTVVAETLSAVPPTTTPTEVTVAVVTPATPTMVATTSVTAGMSVMEKLKALKANQTS